MDWIRKQKIYEMNPHPPPPINSYVAGKISRLPQSPNNPGSPRQGNTNRQKSNSLQLPAGQNLNTQPKPRQGQAADRNLVQELLDDRNKKFQTNLAKKNINLRDPNQLVQDTQGQLFCVACKLYKHKIHICASFKKWINLDIQFNFFIIGETSEDVRATNETDRNSSLLYHFRNRHEMNEKLTSLATEERNEELRKKRQDELNILEMTDLEFLMNYDVYT